MGTKMRGLTSNARRRNRIDVQIVHDAVRRDVSRARAAVADPRTDSTRRRAIDEHLRWMMEVVGSPVAQAATLPWLVDGLDHTAYEQVCGQVSPLQRRVLMPASAGSYRRSATVRWGPENGPFMPATRAAASLPAPTTVSVVVPADRQEVWRVLTDVTRTREWSREVTECHWVGPARAERGGRFRGTSKRNHIGWAQDCVLLRVVDGELWQYQTMGDPLTHGQTRWSIELHDAPGHSTRITQTCQVLYFPKSWEWILNRVMPGHLARADEFGSELPALGRLAATGEAA